MAGELDPGQAPGLELRLDQAEHAGELRKQQHPPPLGQHFGQKLHQLRHLGRFAHLAGGLQRHQVRVTADLAQLEQRIQDRDLRLGQAFGMQGFAHGFFHAQADGFVQIGLGARQLHPHHGFHLGGQLGRHQGLSAAQHERRYAGTQLGQPSGVTLFFYGVAKQLAKPLLAAQKAGHQEVEQTPDFAQVVFHGRARQAQPVARLQCRHHLGRVGAGVLDVLRLVQHHQVPLQLQPALTVALKQ